MSLSHKHIVDIHPVLPESCNNILNVVNGGKKQFISHVFVCLIQVHRMRLSVLGTGVHLKKMYFVFEILELQKLRTRK